MSINNAKFFLEKIQADSSFRGTVTKMDTENEFSLFLDEADMKFSSSEAEEAFNMLHVACQFEAEAESLKNAYLYYQLIVASFKK